MLKYSIRTNMQTDICSRQSGYTLAEMIIVVMIAGILSSIGMTAMQALSENNIASNLGTGLNAIYTATSSYVVANQSPLSNNQPVAGFANPLAPTVQELSANHFLPGGFSSKGYGGGTWIVQIQQQGVCPGSCNLVWTVYLNKAPMENGQPSVKLAGSAAQKSGVMAGYSSSASPATITGINSQWSAVNPMGAQVGILAAQGNFNNTQFAQFLPRSGNLPMTGDLQMTDTTGTAHNINGVNTVNATTVNANTGIFGTIRKLITGTWGGNYAAVLESSMTGGEYMVINGGTADGNTYVSAKTGASVFLRPNANDWTHQAFLDTSGTWNVSNGVIASGNVVGGSNVIAGNNAVTLSSNGRMATNSLNPNDLPAGWGGGVRTWDVYASGTVGAGNGGGAQPSAYMDSAGTIANQNFNVTPSGALTAASLQVNGTSYLGAGCTNGQIVQDGSGMPLYCINGVFSQTPRTATTAGAPCGAPGVISRDGNNNLYICN